MTYPHPKRRFVPQAILTKSGKLKTAGTPVNTVRPVYTDDSKPIVNYSISISNAFKRGHSQVIRPFNKATHNRRSTRKKRVIDSGCSRHMTGNKCYLTDYEDYDGGFVSFKDGKGRISRKCKIKTGTLDFDELLDESQVLLRVPRKDNIYSVDLKSVVPTGGLTCLFAKATIDESDLWRMRLRHLNYKTMNKL
nr:ribonuclease H-like domain-containing protein [Tanacetum cinerariifolium]